MVCARANHGCCSISFSSSQPIMRGDVESVASKNASRPLICYFYFTNIRHWVRNGLNVRCPHFSLGTHWGSNRYTIISQNFIFHLHCRARSLNLFQSSDYLAQNLKNIFVHGSPALDDCIIVSTPQRQETTAYHDCLTVLAETKRSQKSL